MIGDGSATVSGRISTGRVRSQRAGVALAGLGVLSFSLSFPATVWALAGFGPYTVTGLRAVLAAVFAGLALAITRAPLPDRRSLPGLLVVAGGCVVAFPLLTALALQTASTAHSAVVIGLLPLATALVASLRRGGRRPAAVFWIAATVGAAAVVSFALLQNHGAPTGADLLLAAALLACAAGYAEGGRLAAIMPSWQVIAWAVALAAPVGLVVSVFALAAEPVHPTAGSLAGLLYLAAISQFGGFVVWYRGMAVVGVARASQLQLAQPLLTLAWAALLMGEQVPLAAPVVAIVVLGCILMTLRSGRRGSIRPS